ncbi:nicotinamide mononucleotide transporter [Ilyomonas limi]|uniref:Nicotinamide riboside transporter PnuC n=1 Tax=Ilyomonas limi TaxID=2575867 RepID=A0A4U3L6G4_9BACT|nr:nicotinamide riboside transporter PnuC [Ilyomonas limi]TKK70841.1 nicotinamide mononucleotide transporter [Ilyomonas limi]
MNISEWFRLFIVQLKETSIIEWLGVAFGVAEVLFAKANKIWLYPCGIISVVLSSYIFIVSGLYAESALNGYYLVMSIYGWWFWIKKKNEPPLPVSWSSKRDWMVTLSIVFIGFALLYFLLSRFTNSTVPFWDAWVSATAWAGMWLLAKRKIENWILLNISNAFAIPLLFHKHLPLYALLTLFLFIIAVQGFLKWKKVIAVSHKNRSKAAVAFQ